MKKFFISLFGANWRTTLAGYAEGLTMTALDLADAYSKNAFNQKHGIALLVAAAMIVKGHVSKDKDVTGGTIQQ